MENETRASSPEKLTAEQTPICGFTVRGFWHHYWSQSPAQDKYMHQTIQENAYEFSQAWAAHVNTALKAENEKIWINLRELEVTYARVFQMSEEAEANAESLRSQLEEARTALRELDSYVDVNQPIENGEWGFEDASGINKVFEKIAKINAEAALSVSEKGTHEKA